MIRPVDPDMLWVWTLLACVWLQIHVTMTVGTCSRIPQKDTNYSFPYKVLFFQTLQPIQNIVFNQEYDETYIASQNVIEAIDSNFEKLWEIKTGPLGSPKCQTCNCGIENDSNSPVDTDNQVLVLDTKPFLPFLYICGSNQFGICSFYELESGGKQPSVHKCLFNKKENSPSHCPDCIASPLGTQVRIIEDAHTSFFFTAATINSTIGARYARHSISMRRLLATENGFETDVKSLTVLPQFQDSFPIEYIYTFSTLGYTYFLSVQRENLPKQGESFKLQTHLGRLGNNDEWMYREIILECHFKPKRRKRSSENVVYNVVQAAHFSTAEKDLAKELDMVDMTNNGVLYTVFAVTDNKGFPTRKSALCAFSVSNLNDVIKQGVKACCSANSGRLSRGLCHFQTCDSCPHEVRLKVVPYFSHII